MKYGFESSVIKSKIKEKIKQGKTNYIIYPNGYLGAEIKAILREFQAHVEFYIDNKSYDGIHVFSIQQAIDRGIGDSIILIASIRESCYSEIRENIYKAFPKDSILDLYARYEITEEKIDNCLLDLTKYLNEVRNQC